MVPMTRGVGSSSPTRQRARNSSAVAKVRLQLSAPAYVCSNGAGAASYASGAARALQSVTCQTVIRVQSPDDMQFVLMANDLVAETFYDNSDNPVLDAVNYNSYRLRSAAQTMSLHMGPGRNHATIVAFSSAAQQQQQSRPHPSSREQPPVGVVNVTMMQASSAISAAIQCKLGTPFAMITNMAVTPAYRRRGIAHLLMQAAIRAALLELDYCPDFAMLLAYKYYEPAVRLYQSWGFEYTSWQDPLWLADAEKGKMGRQRRIMMVKELSGPGLLATPLSIA